MGAGESDVKSLVDMMSKSWDDVSVVLESRQNGPFINRFWSEPMTSTMAHSVMTDMTVYLLEAKKGDHQF